MYLRHGQQVFVVLNHRAFESPLPHMPARLMKAVITVRMRDQQALHDPAD